MKNIKTVRVDELHEKWKKSPDYMREYQALELEFSDAAKDDACLDSSERESTEVRSSHVDVPQPRK